jgi:hypothetical protein
MQKFCSRACGYCPTGVAALSSNQTETPPADPDSDSLWDGLASTTTSGPSSTDGLASTTTSGSPPVDTSSTSENSTQVVGAVSACSERVPSALLPLMLIIALCRLD